MAEYGMQELERENRDLRREVATYNRLFGTLFGLIGGGSLSLAGEDFVNSYIIDTPEKAGIYASMAGMAAGAALGYKYFGRLTRRE